VRRRTVAYLSLTCAGAGRVTITEMAATLGNIPSIFARGFEARRHSFPRAVEQAGPARFYLCPECLQGFADPSSLSHAHAPPRSVGGSRTVLVCRMCESRAGAKLDIHLKREADLFNFAKMEMDEINAVDPGIYQGVLGDFEHATVGRGGKTSE
jgi:hypothetical protein